MIFLFFFIFYIKYYYGVIATDKERNLFTGN